MGYVLRKIDGHSAADDIASIGSPRGISIDKRSSAPVPLTFEVGHASVTLIVVVAFVAWAIYHDNHAAMQITAHAQMRFSFWQTTSNRQEAVTPGLTLECLFCIAAVRPCSYG